MELVTAGEFAKLMVIAPGETPEPGGPEPGEAKPGETVTSAPPPPKREELLRRLGL